MLNVIEYNEIYNVCMETQDCAAIYTGYSFTGRGNVIRYNYIHDIGQPDTHTHGIYFDSSYSGQTVYGNIFENTGYTGLKAGSGRDNVIVNNIFIDCGSAAMDYAAIEIGHWNRDMWLDGSTIEALVLQDFMGQIGVGNRDIGIIYIIMTYGRKPFPRSILQDLTLIPPLTAMMILHSSPTRRVILLKITWLL